MIQRGIPAKDSWPIYSQQKLVPPHKCGDLAKEIRLTNQTIATVNGSFDLMHAGHLHILHEAACQADLLIVALNTDESIKRYKGEQRPIVPLRYRLQMMSAIGFVDYVTWFDEDDPRTILDAIKPDVHVNGPEWGKDCIEAATVERNGGKIHIISLVDGLSTSNLINKIYIVNKR